MAGELAKLDLRNAIPAVDVPITFMPGRYDHQLDSSLAAAYFNMLDAPVKSLIWFEQSAHNIPFEEPDTFNEILRNELSRIGHAAYQPYEPS